MINEQKIKEKIAKCLGGGYVSDYEINKVYQLFLPALEAIDRPEYYLCRKALEKLNS